MFYIQFYQKSTGYIPGSIPPRFSEEYITDIEATGDRGVIIVDGRMSPDNIRAIAEREGAKRGYCAWALFKGESFTRAKKVSGKWTIYKDKPDTSATSATFGY